MPDSFQRAQIAPAQRALATMLCVAAMLAVLGIWLWLNAGAREKTPIAVLPPPASGATGPLAAGAVSP
jgi:hypothetical protein